MDDGQAVYDAWAPPEVVWSDWVRPVLFAQMPSGSPSDWSPPREEVNLSWLDTRNGETAVVVELPGETAIDVGLAFAEAGLRPVPLFNGCDGPSAVLDVKPLIRRLRDGADRLRRLSLPLDAPPAFLLDSRRMDVKPPPPGQFDNRWLSFPQDFPSGNFLKSHGVKKIVLVDTRPTPRDDLAHTLRRWQEAGLEMSVKDWASQAVPVPLDVPRPPRFRVAWQRLLAMIGLRRNSAGGFGAIVPVPGTSG
jgi:hypothetical protein